MTSLTSSLIISSLRLPLTAGKLTKLQISSINTKLKILSDGSQFFHTSFTEPQLLFILDNLVNKKKNKKLLPLPVTKTQETSGRKRFYNLQIPCNSAEYSSIPPTVLHKIPLNPYKYCDFCKMQNSAKSVNCSFCKTWNARISKMQNTQGSHFTVLRFADSVPRNTDSQITNLFSKIKKAIHEFHANL